MILGLAAAIPLLVALVHAIGHLGGGRLTEERAAWEARLAWQADSQRATVESWVRAIESDALLVASYPTVAWLLHPPSGGPRPFPVEQGAALHLRDLFDGIGRTHGYHAAWALGMDGTALASSTTDEPLPAPAGRLAALATREGGARVHLLRSKGEAYLLVAAPVQVEGTARGATVLMVPAGKMLREALAPPLVPSNTAETVLAAREDGSAVYLTDSPHADAPARLPLGTPRLAMARALAGESVTGTFRDRRGREVLAAVRPVGANWGLVVQIEEAVALASVHADRRESALVLAGTLFVVMALSLLGLRQEAASREARAARSQQRMLAMVERIDEVIFLVDRQYRIGMALGNVRGLYGRDQASFAGRPAAEVRHPDHRGAMSGLFERVREEGRATVETVHLRQDGSPLPVEVSLRHLGADAEPEFVAVVRSLEPRESAEVRLRAVADNFPGCVCLFDQGLRVLLARGQTLMTLGRPPEAVEGRALGEALPADLAATVEPLLRAALAGTPQSVQLPVSGRVHDLRIVPLPAAGGGIESVLVVAQDVTELRQALDEHRRLATAIEQTQEMIVITDPEGRIQYVNPSFERTTGYARGEVLGQRTNMLRSGQHPPEFYRELWSTLRRGEVWSGHLVNRRKDGSLYDEDMVISPIRDAAGQVVNFAAVKRDVSARLQLERELLQAQKMESVGRLAGGVAHDFNNMLSVIVGYADMALRSLRPEDPLHGRLAEILRAADRATSLTRQLLAFSRKQVLQPRVVDLRELVQGLARMLGRLLGEHVLLHCDTPPRPVKVLVDPGQMEQVLLNLAVNARDAMPGGGTLSVTLSSSGGRALLKVSDTGVGMDAQTLAHAFEPFFTTKPVGQGTGLGLSTVYGIVRQSGGEVRVQSEPGRGTTFLVELPLAEADVERATAAPAEERVRGQGTVLLTEDDEALREIAAEALRDAGYRVVEAANAGEALLLADDASLEITILVTDVVMPRVGGRELAERLRAQRPHLPVLFVSGFTDDTLTMDDLGPRSAFLQKPFSPQDLVAATVRTAGTADDPAT